MSIDQSKYPEFSLPVPPCTQVRLRVWPRLLGVSHLLEAEVPPEEQIRGHPSYSQGRHYAHHHRK